MTNRTLQIGTWGGGVAILAASAWITFAPLADANPAGCSNSETGSTSATGVLTSDAKGSCSASLTRTMVSEVKEDISGDPDRLVASSSQANHYGTTYRKVTSTCDGGRTLKYYGRGYFSVDPTQSDSPHTVQHSCR